MSTVLITGARGALGREFAALLPRALVPGSSDLDIRDTAAVDAYVSEHDVRTVIHCAARTSVRYCEENKAETFQTNVLGTQNLCDALAGRPGAPLLVYISTACVFPGDDLEAAYSEEDLPQPKNYYALTKLQAEYVVEGWSRCASTRRALIVRTNFAERGEWKYPTAFTDRFGTYLYPDLVAKKTLELIDANQAGIIHVCGDRRLSMYEFARLSDLSVGEMTLDGYQGPPVAVNMSLRSVRTQTLALQ